MRRRARAAALGATVVMLVLGAADQTGASPRKPFTVSSPAFRNGGTIPEGFTCTGANASLPLRWRGVPKHTTQLALIMEDPDAPNGTFVHWVAWGIDPKLRKLPEQVLPPSVLQGASGAGRAGYLGPCPPPADGAHHYRITLYALSAAPAVTSGSATAADLRAAIRGHVRGTARLVGLYDR
jgi:Raf kinase inhibitor-like YbhB/YbcL family protein